MIRKRIQFWKSGSGMNQNIDKESGTEPDKTGFYIIREIHKLNENKRWEIYLLPFCANCPTKATNNRHLQGSQSFKHTQYSKIHTQYIPMFFQNTYLLHTWGTLKYIPFYWSNTRKISKRQESEHKYFLWVISNIIQYYL